MKYKNFSHSLWGYHREEVRRFLSLRSKQWERLNEDFKSLKEQMRKKELQLLEYREREKLLKSTIEMATEMAGKIRQDAEKEAKLIIADAQQRAEIIVRDSRDSLRKLYGEMADIKRTRLEFVANLRSIAQVHLHLLDQAEQNNLSESTFASASEESFSSSQPHPPHPSHHLPHQAHHSSHPPFESPSPTSKSKPLQEEFHDSPGPSAEV